MKMLHTVKSLDSPQFKRVNFMLTIYIYKYGKQERQKMQVIFILVEIHNLIVAYFSIFA